MSPDVRHAGLEVRLRGLGHAVRGDRRGSLPVFERQWRAMLAAAEPEFGPQERGRFAKRPYIHTRGDGLPAH
jgi:hypothetical protein